MSYLDCIIAESTKWIQLQMAERFQWKEQFDFIEHTVAFYFKQADKLQTSLFNEDDGKRTYSHNRMIKFIQGGADVDFKFFKVIIKIIPEHFVPVYNG